MQKIGFYVNVVYFDIFMNNLRKERSDGLVGYHNKHNSIFKLFECLYIEIHTDTFDGSL